jgi:acyl-CoA synthetase (AMP-forming)/AMP-acid ligase II
VIVAAPSPGGEIDVAGLTSELKLRLPAYMVPMHIELRPAPLPRNPNGKIDRKLLSIELRGLFGGEAA